MSQPIIPIRAAVTHNQCWFTGLETSLRVDYYDRKRAVELWNQGRIRAFLSVELARLRNKSEVLHAARVTDLTTCPHYREWIAAHPTPERTCAWIAEQAPRIKSLYQAANLRDEVELALMVLEGERQPSTLLESLRSFRAELQRRIENTVPRDGLFVTAKDGANHV